MNETEPAPSPEPQTEPECEPPERIAASSLPAGGTDRVGFIARLADAITTSDFGTALSGVRSQERAAVLRDEGAPVQLAEVVAVHDTGMTIREQPRLTLVLDLGTSQITITSLVPRDEVPRRGDRVVLVRDPRTDRLLSAGLSRA